MREAHAHSRSPGLAGDRRKGFPIFRVGNQIAEYLLKAVGQLDAANGDLCTWGASANCLDLIIANWG
jgi:hypothetical protein